MFLVWPAVLALLLASGQERQVVARVTASGHESDSGECVTASGHSDLPGGQGNAYADGVTGSGQLTATGHTESGHCETGLSVNESFHAATGSGQKTATGHGKSGHEKRATWTMTGVDALDRKQEEERERERRRRPRELLVRDQALLSFRAPRSKDWEPREDSTRRRDFEVSLDSLRRRVCGEEWGDNRGSGARRGSLLRAGSSRFAHSRRRRRSGSAPACTRRQSRNTPTPLAGPRSSGRGGSLSRHNTRCSLRPPLLPLPT